MSGTRPAEPARLVVGALSAFPRAWQAARGKLLKRFGRADLETGPFDFDHTDYYADEMGPKLSRWFISFEKLIAQDEIAGIKHFTNALETELTAAGSYSARRPVNLDPGYVTLAKLVLATAKDHAHRVAVGQDMYAEVTLRWRDDGGDGRFEAWPWTYSDYRQESYLDFFSQVREKLRAAMESMES